MNTVSIALPLPTSSSHLRVPSDDTLSRHHGGRSDRRAAGELRAQRLGEIAHRVELGRPAAVDPAHELARAERLLVEARDERAERVAIQSEQVHGFHDK